MGSHMLAILLVLALGAADAVRTYDTTATRVASAKLNVHLVCHTHDDGGWLKTFDEYYFGSRADIQVASVQTILDAVVLALQANPDRKFVYAETGFFSRWWGDQSAGTQDLVRGLVAGGQLDFVNGGWVQHDEAAAHYVAMIDQTTRGHRFLNATFGRVPRVGWQIDPFGHSATQASLLAGALGFDALFFGRADYQDMDIRRAQHAMELVWRGAASYGRCADIFTHNYPSGNYGPPGGFFFEYAFTSDPPLMDDPTSPTYNIPDRVDKFVAAAHEWANYSQGTDVMFMMGSDFNFANANFWYENLDRLIHYVNKDGRVNVFYSTPALYAAAKASYPTDTESPGNADITWPLKTDDFFPYADTPHSYWTGYFVSRAASKGYIRAMTAYLQVARQLQALTASLNDSSRQPGGGAGGGASGAAALDPLDELEAAVSLTQHHDSITGTEKQAVTNDYHRLLHQGWVQAADMANKRLAQLMLPAPKSGTGLPGSPPLVLVQCPLLNASICWLSVNATARLLHFNTPSSSPSSPSTGSSTPHSTASAPGGSSGGGERVATARQGGQQQDHPPWTSLLLALYNPANTTHHHTTHTPSGTTFTNSARAVILPNRPKMEDTHRAEYQPLLDQEMSRQKEEEQQVVPEAHEEEEEEERRPVVLYKGIQQREAGQLQCPIHKGLMHDPVGTGKCKHVFCRSCLASWVALQGHCPLDANPAQVDQLVPADAAAEKLNRLLIHCRWGVVQDEETGAWVAAGGEGYCPALITIGDRKAHEDSCAYCPAVLQTDEGSTSGGAAGQLMNRLQFPQVQVNVDQAMQAIRTNLTRFERVLAERMDVLLAQVRSLIEEQNIYRLRSGASGAMTNFKEEMEAAIAGLMEKQVPLFRSIATKSESLCSEASSVARAKGNALYEGAVHMRHQAAVAGGEAISRLDVLAQELMGEVKLALMRSLEPESCPTPPPPPPPDCVLEEEQEAEPQEEDEQEQEAEPQEEEEAQPHVTAPASVTVEDADWDDCPSWIPAQPTLHAPPRYPPPPPPRSAKMHTH